MPYQNGIATGTIFPGRFVKLDTTEGGIAQCGSGDTPIGISALGGRRSPYIDQTNPQAAALVNEPIGYWDLASSGVALEVVAAVTPGARLKPDTNGKGTPTTGATDQYGAVSHDIAPAGTFAKVTVEIGEGQ